MKTIIAIIAALLTITFVTIATAQTPTNPIRVKRVIHNPDGSRTYQVVALVPPGGAKITARVVAKKVATPNLYLGARLKTGFTSLYRRHNGLAHDGTLFGAASQAEFVVGSQGAFYDTPKLKIGIEGWAGTGLSTWVPDDSETVSMWDGTLGFAITFVLENGFEFALGYDGRAGGTMKRLLYHQHTGLIRFGYWVNNRWRIGISGGPTFSSVMADFKPFNSDVTISEQENGPAGTAAFETTFVF